MTLASGARITPARINVQRGTVTLGSSYTLTGTMTDLSGVSLSFTTVNPTSYYLACWAGDFQLVTAGSLTGVVQLVVDGTAITATQAIWNPANVAAGARETESQSYSGTLTAGSHTFKLQANAVISSGSARLNSGHTQLTVVVFP